MKKSTKLTLIILVLVAILGLVLWGMFGLTSDAIKQIGLVSAQNTVELIDSEPTTVVVNVDNQLQPPEKEGQSAQQVVIIVLVAAVTIMALGILFASTAWTEMMMVTRYRRPVVKKREGIEQK